VIVRIAYWFLKNPVVIWIFHSWPVSIPLGWILRCWEVNDVIPEDEKPQLIAVPSYAASPEGLTNGSKKVAWLAADLAKKYPMAKVIGGEFRDNKPGSNEWNRKLTILPPDRSISVGPVSSSIDEQIAIVKEALKHVPTVTSAIVVCEGAHSRRDRVVWRYFMPGTRFYFRSVSAKKAADPKNPMIAQRHWQIWLLANLVAFPLFKWFPGVRRLARKNSSQPVS
jgi:hypothetical protein